MDATVFASKTLDYKDLDARDIAPVTRSLRRFALRLGARNTPFAVNGILKRRFWVRRHKMWEYARATACVMHKKASRLGASARAANASSGEGGPERRKFRVLDFGGAATLPIFYLAAQDCEVWCLDVDTTLTNWTNQLAWKRSWRMRALPHDLTVAAAPYDWGSFDAVISCSVLEHIPKAKQALVFERLARLLKPRGILLFSFDYGESAPVEDAVRTEAEVNELVRASGLEFLDPRGFRDNGLRFALDKRHPRKRFTFASLFLTAGGGTLPGRRD